MIIANYAKVIEGNMQGGRTIGVYTEMTQVTEILGRVDLTATASRFSLVAGT